jgi:hypothetical protein
MNRLRRQRGDAAVRRDRRPGRPGGRPSAGLINPRLYQLLARDVPGLDVVTGGNTVKFRPGRKLRIVYGVRAGDLVTISLPGGTVNAPLFAREPAGQ